MLTFLQDLSYSEENPTSVMRPDAVAPEEVSFLSEEDVELASAIKSKADDSEHGEDDDFSYDFDFETVPNEDPFSDAAYARFAVRFPFYLSWSSMLILSGRTRQTWTSHNSQGRWKGCQVTMGPHTR
jgi:hypothetical protein